MEDLHKAVGPWVDQSLTPTAQLMLRQVELEAEGLTADQLRLCLLATWRGWMVERQVVIGAMAELAIDLQVEFPTGFAPLDILKSHEEGMD